MPRVFPKIKRPPPISRLQFLSKNKKGLIIACVYRPDFNYRELNRDCASKPLKPLYGANRRFYEDIRRIALTEPTYHHYLLGQVYQHDKVSKIIIDTKTGKKYNGFIKRNPERSWQYNGKGNIERAE